MARAPETGFYFEPLSERLALVVEGSPFPSDDHWAWLGDPIDMTPEQAQLLVAVRWPGIDPGSLEVEFDLNFERAVKAKEDADREKRMGVTHLPTEFDVDINQLLTQAEVLRNQVRQLSLQAPSREADEAAAEAVRLQQLIEQARNLTEPNLPGRVLSVGQAPAQSNALVRGAPPAPAQAATAPAPPIHPPGKPVAAEPESPGPVLIPEIVAEPQRVEEPKRINVRPRARPRPEPTSAASPPESRARKPAAKPPAPTPAEPPKQLERKPPPEPPLPKPEGKPDAPPGKRRPNIRDKR